MIKKVGLFYICKKTKRILLIYDKCWTFPTFTKVNNIFDDVQPVFLEFSIGKIIPIDLYHSNDNGFAYETCICLVDNEFIPTKSDTFSWASFSNLPKNLHKGLKFTLQNKIIVSKIETVLELDKYLKNV